jgi:hypothetical protein
MSVAYREGLVGVWVQLGKVVFLDDVAAGVAEDGQGALDRRPHGRHARAPLLQCLCIHRRKSSCRGWHSSPICAAGIVAAASFTVVSVPLTTCLHCGGGCVGQRHGQRRQLRQEHAQRTHIALHRCARAPTHQGVSVTSSQTHDPSATRRASHSLSQSHTHTRTHTHTHTCICSFSPYAVHRMYGGPCISCEVLMNSG